MDEAHESGATTLDSIRDWAWIPAMLLALGIGSVAMLIGSNLIRERLIAGRIDLVRAVGDVQTRTAISHLWVEELVTGDDVDRAGSPGTSRDGRAARPVPSGYAEGADHRSRRSPDAADPGHHVGWVRRHLSR